MRDIEPLASYGAVVPEDVQATIRDLKGGNRYAAADLYNRYADAAREAGRSPGHPVAFGQALKAHGLIRVKINIGGPGRGKKAKKGDKSRQVSAWLL